MHEAVTSESPIYSRQGRAYDQYVRALSAESVVRSILPYICGGFHVVRGRDWGAAATGDTTHCV